MPGLLNAYVAACVALKADLQPRHRSRPLAHDSAPNQTFATKFGEDASFSDVQNYGISVSLIGALESLCMKAGSSEPTGSLGGRRHPERNETQMVALKWFFVLRQIVPFTLTCGRHKDTTKKAMLAPTKPPFVLTRF